MNYQLTNPYTINDSKIEIDKEKFDQISHAKSVLTAALAIEASYDLLLNNYLALEKEVLYTTANRMVSRTATTSDYFDHYKTNIAFNQCIANLLTSTKLYTDHTAQHVKICIPGDATLSDTIEDLFSTEYDSHFEYRFMEALRNHVQHQGLAVHNVIRSSSWTSMEIEDALMVCSTQLIFHKSEVENSKFKKCVLKDMPDQVELLPAVRQYVESLNTIHIQIRELITQSTSQSRDIITAAISEREKVNDDKSAGIMALSYNLVGSDMTIDKKVPILLNWDDVRLQLIKRNAKLTNLSKCYVSGVPHKLAR